jgi:hypothetical protein
MLTGCPNGSHPAGSTNINNPTSIPASNEYMPNANSTTTANDDVNGKTPQRDGMPIGLSKGGTNRGDGVQYELRPFSEADQAGMCP